MILTILRVMFLSTIRDRGALFLTFALPPVMYMIFAAIFSGTGQGDPELRVGLHPGQSDSTIVASILEMPNQTVATYQDRTLMELELVEGRLDGAIVIQGAPETSGESAVLVLSDPGKRMAGAVLAGRITQMLAEKHPDALLNRQARGLEGVIGTLTPGQAARLEGALSQPAALTGGAPVVARETLTLGDKTDPTVSYYAAAIAIMFLLISATQTASGLIDDRRSGILDRFAASPGGIDVVVLGRTLFIALQAMLQASIVFAVAGILHGVPLMDYFGNWLVATVIIAAGVAGIGMCGAALCATRTQAQTVATFAVLALSAIGGSMVPRFLMPDWLRDLGIVSPNAWAIDLYQGLLTRDRALLEMSGPLLAFLIAALIGTFAAVALARWRLRLS